MTDLNLINPSDVYGSASTYNSPNFNPNPTPSSGGGGLIYSSMGLSSIGAIISGFQQANAYKAQGEYESTVANTNAKIAQLQEKETLDAGNVEASRQDLKTRQDVGSILASQGASGVDVRSGSSALVRNSVGAVGNQDELTIRSNAQRQAFGYKVQATEDDYRGQFAQLTAKAESEQTLLSGGLKAISGPLSIYSNYLRWSRGLGGNSSLPFPDVN